MKKDYTIGLDIGTNSVGWAVIDDEFEVLDVDKKVKIVKEGKTRGKKRPTKMWGVRLFEEGQVAADRRLKRTARRRLTRRKWRLRQLQNMFYEPLQEIDDNFFARLDESFLQFDDKAIKEKYPLFRTELEEKAYYEQFPTIYHLRKRLVDDKTQADLRQIYLAIHHIMKYRGHFLFEEFSLESDNFDSVLLCTS